MPVEVIDGGAPEVVIPLSAMLETPNEPEVIDPEVVPEVEVEVKPEVTVEKVEEKLEEAIETGASSSEISELRSLLRDMRNENIRMKTQLEQVTRVQKGEFNAETDKLSDLETYQTKLEEVAARDFSTVLAVMEVNPKYEDFKSVCTNSNFEDIFETVASNRSEKNGTDFTVELVKVKSEVWSLPNPYKYMYDTIKEHHPKFKVAPVVAEIKKEEEVKPPTAKEIVAKKVVTAPGSVANLGGGDETKGGWTAEKIDNMPETDLHKVPRDIYNKWLSGELD